ncbi:MAG: hypothetical protein JSS34_08715, partial [Proteobacteria bacterium]|nr:hypothetical protein [Pseudomonadota bacterium]
NKEEVKNPEAPFLKPNKTEKKPPEKKLKPLNSPVPVPSTQQIVYRSQNLFHAIDFNKAKSVPPTVQQPEGQSSLRITNSNHVSTSASMDYSSLDLLHALSLKSLDGMLEKVKKQNQLYSVIVKGERLDFYEPKLPNQSGQTPWTYLDCLKPYQAKAADYLHQFFRLNKFYPVLAWEMGTGKTLTYLNEIFRLISEGKEIFPILVPKSAVDPIYKTALKEMWAVKSQILQIIIHANLNGLYNANLDQFYQELLNYLKEGGCKQNRW